MTVINVNNKLKADSNRIVWLTAFVSCLVFFAFHIIYLVFFAVVNVKLLVFINIGSCSFYILMLLFIKFRLYNTYVILTGFEIAAYMTVATIILGPNSGFQLCLIALGALEFFAGYFSRFGKKRIKPVLFCLLNMILFTFVYFWCQNNEPIETINSTIETILFVTHIVITFGFSTTFLSILTIYTVKLENKVKKESETDKLTNISNRKGLSNYFDRIGDQKNNYVVAIFDIDNFKKFNDINGHLCGDYVLKEIARIASDNSKDDFVSRWGGEEFVVIAKKDEDINETYKRIDAIRDTIANYNFKYNNKKLKSTITIGVALYEDDESLDAWITRADKKLYVGKHNGKNQMVV